MVLVEKVEADKDNLVIETVDILHMILSYIILYKSIKGTNLLPYFSKQLEKDNNILETTNLKGEQRLIVLVEQTARYFLNEDPKKGLIYFSEVIKEVAGFEMIRKVYIGKSILNKLRQEYGYKAGSYKKIIEGKEDNFYLMEYIKMGLEISEVKEKLENLISKYNKKG